MRQEPGPLPSCPRKRSLWALSMMKKDTSQQWSISEFPNHPKDTLSASLRAATTQPHHNHIPQKEPSFSKPPNPFGSALTLKYSSEPPPCPVLPCSSVTRGSSFHLLSVTVAAGAWLKVGVSCFSSAPTANMAFHRAEALAKVIQEYISQWAGGSINYLLFHK